MNITKLIAAAVAFATLTATASVTPGEWNTKFQDSLDYAEANNVPIVVVWGSTGCSHCKALHAVLEDDAIMDWAEEHPIMMVSKYEKASSENADYVAAKAWIKSIDPNITQYPFVGVYWKKADGTVVCKTAFTGRNGTMPATTPKNDLAGQFANSLDQLVGDYPEGGSAENAPKNPHWVGEYTAATLPYGEWTMDFDVAKAKVRTYGGKLVAMFGGPLWCPNCVAIEDDVFATSTFKKWAKEEKLVLVHFDQGQASSPATAAGTDKGRLLTTVPASNTGESGAEYLARHNIDPNSSTVKAVIDQVTELTAKWLAPESTAARLGNPTVLLLNDAGTAVDARFLRQNEGYTMDLDENMSRLEDLISLGGDNEKKGYCTTTPLTLAPGESDEVEYHICSRKFAYRLRGLKAGDYVTATVSSKDADAQDVYVSLVTASGTEIACAKKCVMMTDPLTAEQAAELYLMTAAYGKTNSEVQGAFFGDATSFEATVSVEASEEKPEQFVSFKSLTKSELKELNGELYQKQSATVPVYENINLGGRRLVGTLAVSVTSANRISAKFTGAKTISFSGTWDEISQSSGLVRTTLAKTVSRVAYELELAMDAKGGFEATVSAAGETLGSGAAADGDISSYAGNYTVTLVDAASEDRGGTGYLTLKITNKGKATVKGVMPDGTSISVSVVLSPNADGTATLPVYKSSSKYALSLALAIDPDADETWGAQGEMDTVRAVTGCVATWTTDDETAFAIYGGYWSSTTPLAICEHFDLSDELGVVIGGETNDTVTATKNGFKVTKDVLTSLSFTKSTGAFSGKAKVYVDSLGKTVTATVKGVLLPGWIDCQCGGEPVVERPYGSGTVYYKVGKTTVSLPIDLVAEAAE